jgi:hypothetical protein
MANSRWGLYEYTQGGSSGGLSHPLEPLGQVHRDGKPLCHPIKVSSRQCDALGKQKGVEDDSLALVECEPTCYRGRMQMEMENRWRIRANWWHPRGKVPHPSAKTREQPNRLNTSSCGNRMIRPMNGSSALFDAL